MSSPAPRILYCHCRYAQVVPVPTKDAVLRGLCASEMEFEAVPDLCELAARRDSRLAHLAQGGPLKIAACFPRAVKWLFASAGAPLPGGATEVLNMRTDAPEALLARLGTDDLSPNLPEGAATRPPELPVSPVPTPPFAPAP